LLTVREHASIYDATLPIKKVRHLPLAAISQFIGLNHREFSGEYKYVITKGSGVGGNQASGMTLTEEISVTV
jgi:hypothetical protein